MAITTGSSNWLRVNLTIAVAVISSAAAISVYVFRKKSKDLDKKIRNLEISLKASQDKYIAERQGRVRAQQVEAVQANMVLLSGVDLVDGTPVLDIKPYLPYCDSIEEAKVPKWVTVDNLAVASVSFSHEFSSSLANCWMTADKKSLYASPDELQSLIKQILSWDIRSPSQRINPHNLVPKAGYPSENHQVSYLEDGIEEEDASSLGGEQGQFPSPGAVIYHLMLEGLDVSYKIDRDSNVTVGTVTLSPEFEKISQHRCNYMTWTDVVG